MVQLIVTGLSWQSAVVTVDVCRVELLAMDHVQLVWTKRLRGHPIHHDVALFAAAHRVDVYLLVLYYFQHFLILLKLAIEGAQIFFLLSLCKWLSSDTFKSRLVMHSSGTT